jgi:hypothetical protein
MEYRGSRFRWVIFGVGLLALALIVAGCGEEQDVETLESETVRGGWFIVQSPVTTGAEEENILVTWKGYTEGHQVGASSTFTVSLENVSRNEIRVRYCLSLLDREGVVAELAQKRQRVSPRVSTDEEVTFRFPDDLAAGTYGLTLIVQDPVGPDAGVVYIGVDGAMDHVIEIPRSVVEQAVDACPPIENEESG